ncbi:MAG: HlyD family efflux transporter periplasmic adaptor subunit [Acidobacteriota bacterium]|nr:HlyD family efflux transporter periplasmic adaptor subunit [Acidobacteriota bacterium]
MRVIVRINRASQVAALAAIVLVASAAVGFVVRGDSPRTDALKLSGNIELLQINIAFKTSGLIAEILTDEGRDVKKGDVIARLSGEQLQRMLEREKAAELEAKALQAQAEASLEWQRRMFTANLAARKAEMAAASAHLQELEKGSRLEEIAEARAAVSAATAQNEHAQKDWDRARRLFELDDISARQHDQFRVAAQSAAAALHQAEQRLALIEAGPRTETIAAQKEQVARARAEVAVVEATRFEIKRRELEIAARQAEVERARAQVQLMESQIKDLVVTSPVDGVVLLKAADAGEIVAAGTTIATIGDIDRPWLRAYVPETELGRIKIGQPVRVSSDSYPGKVYAGRISFISSEAEFTPKQVQTTEERVKLVYRIKVDIANPNRELKLNMPVDALILF